MAWNNASDVRLSDLGLITAGNGSNTSASTSETQLRADCANSGSATNVRLWDSFKPGTADISFSGTGVSDTDWTFSANTTVTATMGYSSSGTYFSSRVTGQNSWLYTKWEANRTSGNDTSSWSSRSATQAVMNHALGGTASTDFWTIRQVVPSGTAFERFYCNTTGSNVIDTENVTVYDTSGEGGGLLCFVEGTLITMSDGSYKKIEEIEVGDLVLTGVVAIENISPDEAKLKSSKVTEVVSVPHDNIVEYEFSNGVKNRNTDDHAYHVVGKGWSSYKPELTEERYGLKSSQIEVGDKFLTDDDKEITLNKITEIDIEYNTYTIATDTKTYYANTVLVHSEI